MTRSFGHQGLRKLFETGSAGSVRPNHTHRLRMQSAALDTALTLKDMDMPGFRLDPLKGREKGLGSIWVNGNWRATFEFLGGDAHSLGYEEDHWMAMINPPHPGEFITRVYLQPNSLSGRELALKLGRAASTMSRI